MEQQKQTILENIRDQSGKILKEVELAHWAKNQSYSIDEDGRITSLNCHGLGLSSFELGPELEQIQYLDLSGNCFSNLIFNQKFPELKYLDISNNESNEEPSLESVKFIQDLPELTHLFIYKSGLKEVSFPKEGLEKLNTLHLAENSLTKISLPDSLDKLETLYLQGNKIEEAEGLEDKTFLVGFLGRDFVNLKIHDNPFLSKHDLSLDENEDQSQTLLNWLKPYIADQNARKNITLPAKVLLLGNHGSGKSSLLHFVESGNLPVGTDSTHIIRIANHPEGAEVPEAIFYDFGGQDYYHGLYRIFLSLGAVQVLLWNPETNYNQILGVDSSQDPEKTESKGSSTIHFHLKYWLGQNLYLLEKSNRDSQANPMLLLQRDSEIRKLNSGLPRELLQQNNVQAEYLLVLCPKIEKAQKNELNPLSRQLMLTHLKALISKTRVEQPVFNWYQKFYTFLLDKSKNNSPFPTSFADLKKLLKKDYGRKEKDGLKEHLIQWHRQGLILYYPDLEQIQDQIWLSPRALAHHVHDSLFPRNKQALYPDGKMPKDKMQGKSKNDQLILELLQAQKVLFLHEPGRQIQEYIIPNYLPMAEAQPSVYDLIRFGLDDSIAFALKFDAFIPFGFINQLICFFGELPDTRHFWRNQLIFTIDQNCKVLLHLDFVNLEIKVCTFFKESRDEAKIHAFLYDSIVNLYWDCENMVPWESFERRKQVNLPGKRTEGEQAEADFHHLELRGGPGHKREIKDLYISLDGQNFVLVQALDEAEDSPLATSFPLHKTEEEQPAGRQLDLGLPKEIPIFPFQPYTDQKLKKMKKIFISYSNKDHLFKEELQAHLKPLADFRLAQSWDCEQMVPGKWNDQIQEELESSDIVIFMMSINFVNSGYILFEEVKKAFDAVKDKPGSKHLVFVLVRDFAWNQFAKYKDLTGLSDDKFKDIKGGAILGEIPEWQFLPYETVNVGEKNGSRALKAVEEWEYRNKAYMQVVEKLTALL